MSDYDFEAWAQARVASSKPNPGQQAAESMRSVGIGGLGGRTTTAAAQRIQDQFSMFRDDDDRGSTYDYIPQTVTSGLGTPLTFTQPTMEESKKEDDRNLDQKIYDKMKEFGAKFFSPPKETSSDYVLDVYETSPMFRIPTVPEVTEMGIEKSFEQKLQEMFDSQGQNVYTPEIEGTGSYDEVPAPSTNKNLMRNRINNILKDVIAPNSKEYEIQKGDTLSDISLREGVRVEDLAQVNEIENPNLILEGGTLIIPQVQEMEKAKEYVLRVTTRGDESLVDLTDPDAQFYQSGVSMDQRDFAPEDMTGFAGMGPDPSTGQGIMSPTPTTLTAEQRTALSDMGSDVMRTNLQKITNARGNYSQTALTNAIDKGVRNTTKKALLKGSVETEIGDRGLITEGTGYRLNRAYQMFEDATVDAALESLPLSEQTRIRNGAASNALGLAIMDIAYDGGSAYRGRGIVQLTHRRNYQAVEDILESNGINIDLVNNPDLANDTRYALPIAMAYLEHAGLNDTAAENSSTKDLNNRINAGADSTIANERWENVVQALRDSGQDEEADRMENRNEYAAQETVDTEVDGSIGPNSRAAMREWLSERNITIPQNATDMDLVVLVNENS